MHVCVTKEHKLLDSGSQAIKCFPMRRRIYLLTYLLPLDVEGIPRLKISEKNNKRIDQ